VEAKYRLCMDGESHTRDDGGVHLTFLTQDYDLLGIVVRPDGTVRVFSIPDMVEAESTTHFKEKL